MIRKLGAISRKTLFFFLLLVGCQYLIKSNFAPEPRYNWDALPYMSLVLKMDGVTDDSLRHSMVYGIARAEMPEAFYEENTDDGNAYRQIMTTDYKAFNEQMPLYSIKAFYLSIVYVLYKGGMSLLTATYLPSATAYYLIGWIIFFFVSDRFNEGIAFFAAGLLALTPSALGVAVLSSPDGISALFMILGLIAFFRDPRSLWMALWFLLAILSRRDNVLFVVLLYGIMIFRELSAKEAFRFRAVQLIGFVLVYWLIGKLTGNPGWKDTFMQSFAYKQPYFMSVDSGFRWDIYTEIMDRVFIRLSNKSVLVFLFSAIVLFGPLRKKIPAYVMQMNSYQWLFILVVFVNVVRFFLFPDIHDRFYFGYFAMLCLILVEAQSKALTE